MFKRKLEQYECACPECDGSGYINCSDMFLNDEILHFNENSPAAINCPLCGNSGIIDWITKMKYSNGLPNLSLDKFQCVGKLNDEWIEFSDNVITKEDFLKEVESGINKQFQRKYNKKTTCF